MFCFTVGTTLDLSLGKGDISVIFTLLALLVPYDCTWKNLILFWIFQLSLYCFGLFG